MSEIADLFAGLEILELLGEGGMGVVYRARQRKLGRLVALKLLPRELSSDPAFAERFLREAQALARLQHPNIVALYDFGESGGYHFLVMEYSDGLNLRQLLRRGGLKPSEALAIVPQICDGLQYAHEAGVIHRDIKPENVLVDRAGRVKITDFGLAKILDRASPSFTLTGTGQVMGTPHYMAPEQLANAHDVDHRADIYSLGVVFYELLTGRLPQGRFAPPSRSVAVDVRLDEVVLRALEQEPERRYQHARELKTGVSSVTDPGTQPADEDVVPPGAVRVRIGGRAWSAVATIGQDVDVESPDAPPGLRSALDTFLGFGGVWIVSGLAFNAGWAALCAAALLFVVAGLVAARRHFGRGAGRVRPWQRALGTIAASALLAASFALLFVAEVGRWERTHATRDSSPQEPGQLIELGEADMANLVARAGGPALPDGGELTAVLESSDVMDRPKIYRARALWIPAVLALGLGVLTFAGASGALRSVRSLWLPLASVCMPALLALAALAGLTAIPRAFAPRAEPAPQVLDADVAGNVSDVSDKLYLAMLEIGARVDTRHRWSVGAPDATQTSFGMQLLSGQPESPFDRWKIGWTGPRRTFPHLILTLAGPTAGNTTAVRIHAGRSAGEDRTRWPGIGQTLLDKIGATAGIGPRP